MRKRKSFKSNNNFYKFEVKSNMLNHINTLHGGELVKHFDNAAGMTAMKFAEKKVVTASIKEVNFFKKILLDDRVKIKTEIFHVGNSSIYIYTEAFIEADNKNLVKAAEAFLIFIGIDDNLNSSEVPMLIFDSRLDKLRSEKIKKKFDF